MPHRPICRSALVLVLAAASGAATAVDAQGFAAAFGATVRATYPDGRFQRYWFKADGTWRAIGRHKTASSGKWTRKGGKVCLKQTSPFASPFRYCTSFPGAAALGSSWLAKDAGGGKIVLSLEKGGGA